MNVCYQGDCLEFMKTIPSNSIDMILCDLPYGITSCKWDSVIPLDSLWAEYKRITKDNAAIVLTCSQPFTSVLLLSNLPWFRHEWVWNKKKPGNIFLAKYQPMKIHENVLVFSKESPNYYPIMEKRDKVKTSKNYGTGEAIGGDGTPEEKTYTFTHLYPKSILEISNANQTGKAHPTQKPVALFEYLIKTYTKEGDLVLDNCAGSGTTGVACKNLGRNFILIEKEPKYVDVIRQRVECEII